MFLAQQHIEKPNHRNSKVCLAARDPTNSSREMNTPRRGPRLAATGFYNPRRPYTVVVGRHEVLILQSRAVTLLGMGEQSDLSSSGKRVQ